MLEFDWDDNKAQSNLKKYGVSFEEAITVFADPLSLTIPDQSHSLTEERFFIIGMSGSQRLLIAFHTERNRMIRIISARKATLRERKQYEEI